MVILSAVISGFFIVTSLVLLTRYRKLVASANESSRLGRNVWDALDARLKRQDERIMDLMARVEVYDWQSRRQLGTEGARERRPVLPGIVREPPEEQMRAVARPQLSAMPEESIGGTDMEVLRLLLPGARTSRQIDQAIGKSREHTARLLKSLFERSLVERDAAKKPFMYRLTDAGRRYLGTGSASR